MTFAALAALRHAPDLLDRFQAKILSPLYDPRALPPEQKPALTVAMAMTEKQGGSDLRQIETQAAHHDIPAAP
jgi:putative acyl-CoA dehydrogenase